MNYIKHLTGFFEKVSIDFDLNPTHISLYMAVFQLWNQNRFQNPIGISRDELMRISKIASSATYHKCMKELTEKGYVNYKPSYNPFKGSTLEVINLDYYTRPIPKKEIKKLKTQQKNKQVIEQPNDHVLNKQQISAKHLPYINNTNSINIVNGYTQKNENDNVNYYHIEPDLPSGVEGRNTPKKLREKKDTEQIPPDWELVLEFFKEKMHSATEAEKFYNHFQSNGWLVGGKAKMKDWKAAARNWMLNAQKFTTYQTTQPNAPKPGNLHTNTVKNYEEPL